MCGRASHIQKKKTKARQIGEWAFSCLNESARTLCNSLYDIFTPIVFQSKQNCSLFTGWWRKKRSILIFGYHNNLHLLNPKWDDFPQQRHSFIRRYPPRRSSDIKWILQTCNWPTMEVADCPNASCHQQTNPDRAILRESAPRTTTLRCGWVD